MKRTLTRALWPIFPIFPGLRKIYFRNHVVGLPVEQAQTLAAWAGYDLLPSNSPPPSGGGNNSNRVRLVVDTHGVVSDYVIG